MWLLGISAEAGQEIPVRVLAVSGADGRAVLAAGDEPAAVHGTGDELGGGRYVVRRIAVDHVVMEEREEGRLPVEIWVYLANGKGVSRVVRLEGQGVGSSAPTIARSSKPPVKAKASRPKAKRRRK
jgi:hypothetical protein